MILEAILNVFKNVITFLMSIFPSLPSFPDGILSSMDYVKNLITGSVGVISYLFTPVITIFIFTSILVIMNFDNVYKLVMWFMHKVRS